MPALHCEIQSGKRPLSRVAKAFLAKVCGWRWPRIGQELLAHLAKLARDRGLARIDWTADPNDERLLRFYDSIGGQQKPDKIFYRLDGDALKRLAS